MSASLLPKVLLINGPNLNMIGTREPHIYGSTTLQELEESLIQEAKNITLTCYQSNSEGDIITAIQKAKQDKVSVIIINPGAYTHTSVGIRDAFLSVQIPFLEVHISNVYAREAFRHTSYLSDVAAGVLVGHGLFGYKLALLRAEEIISHIND